MQEDFLHYVWQHIHLGENLETTAGEKLLILAKGQHNLHAGADFFNAKIQIGNQLYTHLLSVVRPHQIVIYPQLLVLNHCS